MAPDQRLAPTPVHLAQRFVQRMAQESRAVVYWKASQGIARALATPGKDIDLLVAPTDLEAACRILGALGYRQACSPDPRDMPAALHFLAPCPVDGHLEHVHLHTGPLPLGTPGLWPWRLRTTSWLLHTRQPHGAGLDALHPAAECAMWALRACCEPKFWQDAGLDPLAHAQWQAAQAATTPEEIARHTAALLGDDPARLLREARLDCPRWWRQWRKALSQSPALAPAHHPARLAWQRAGWRAEGLAKATFVRLGLGPDPRPQGLRLPRQGRIIALVGPDGAGKSTQCRNLEQWLSPVLDTHHVYLGRGDLISQAQQKLAEAKWAVLEALTDRRRPAPTGIADAHMTATPPGSRESAKRPKAQALALARDLSSLALAQRKMRDLRRATRLRDKGAVVITDRFAHALDPSLDGPQMVPGPADPPWRKALLALERRTYRAMQDVVPDLVVCLHVDPATAYARKPDHRLEDIARKARALREADFGPAPCMHLDAGQPVQEVSRQIREAVWRCLGAAPIHP